MSNFTVIEGGGPPNRNDKRASQALRLLIVEFVRSVIRGYADEERIGYQSGQLFTWLTEAGALERNEDRSSPFPRYLSAPGKQRLNSIVNDAVTMMHEEMTTKLMEPTCASDPVWFIRESRDIENIVLESLKAILETWALDQNARGRAGPRRDLIRSMLRRMGEKEGEAIIAEALKNPRKAMEEAELRERVRNATREASLRERGRPSAKSSLDPPTDE
jgi:hypothetical protein